MFTRRCMLVLPAAVLAALAPVSSSCAQSINVDFGVAGSTPSSWLASGGDRGVWNTIGVLPAGQRANLVSIHGTPVSARIYMIGATSMLNSNNAATAGDDEALIDDMLLSFNNPVDGCVWIEGLRNGTYEVRMHGVTPNNPALLNRMRVDFASPGPMWVGGAWAGSYIENGTYSLHTVTITNGVIGMHAGQQGALYQSGINGLQIRFLGACAADFNDNAIADVPDIFAFLAAWFAGSGAADADDDGVLGVPDIFAFLSAWFTGCS